MKCCITGKNAKVFGRALQCLSKIGDEVCLEGNSDSLALKIVNNSKSAFASIKFGESFFTDYTCGTNAKQFICKISMKSCLPIFKNMRQVEQCFISMNDQNEKLIFQMRCRSDTVKTHCVTIIDQESLQASCPLDTIPNIVSASSKVYDDMFSIFHSSEEEITIEISETEIVVKNYVQGSAIDRLLVKSQLVLRSEEFKEFSITNPTTITFCLRELRAWVVFAEAVRLGIDTKLDKPGRPAVFVFEENEVLSGQLIMSTLAPDDISYYVSSEEHSTNNSHSNIETSHDLSTNPNSSTNKTINNAKSNSVRLVLDKSSSQSHSSGLLFESEVSSQQTINNENPHIKYIFKKCFAEQFDDVDRTDDVLAESSDVE